MHAYQTGVTHERLVQRMIAASALSKVMRDMGDYTQALALNAEVVEWNTAQNASLSLSVSRFLRGSILKEHARVSGGDRGVREGPRTERDTR